MDEFGSAGAVLGAAGGLRLRRCIGDGRVEEILALVAEFLSCVLGEPLRSRSVLSDREALIHYLRAEMAFCPRESLRILYLDAAHRLLADEVAGHGTVDSLSFYAREIVIRALEVGAVGLVLAHNHPSGSPVATKADVAATDGLIRACAPLGIVVLDHLVIAEHGTCSLRGTGLLA